MDALRDLVAGASFLPKSFAFTFLGDEPLAPASPSRAIREGIKILRKGVTQSPPEFLMVTPRGGDVLTPVTVNLSPSKQPSPPSSKPNPCSSRPQSPILMFLKNVKAINNRNKLIWSLLRTRAFSSHDRVILGKFHHNSHESPDASNPCARKVQQVLQPS